MNDLNQRILRLCEQLEFSRTPRKRLPLLGELVDSFAQGDPVAGWPYVREMLRLLRSNGDDRLKAEGYLHAAEYSRLLSRFSQARRYLEKARALQENIPDNLVVRSRLYRTAGFLEGERNGDFNEAVRLLMRGVEYARQSGDRRETESALLSVAEACCGVGDFTAALHHIGECWESIGENIVSVPGGRLCRLLGLAYMRFGDREPALERMEQSVDIHRRVGSLAGLAESEHGLGLVHLALGDPEEALPGLRSSAELFGRLERRLMEVLVLTDLCCAHIALNDAEGARTAWARAAAVKNGLGSRTADNLVLLARGELLTAQGNWNEASILLEEALSGFRASGLVAGLDRAHRALARVCEARADHSGALAHHKMTAELERKRLDDRVRRTLLDLERRASGQQEKNEKKEGTERVKSAVVSIRLAATDELLGRLKERLRTLENGGGKARDHFRELVCQVEAGKDFIRAWEMLEHRLGEIDPDFLNELTRRFPALTPAELRICSMLRMNLANRDIADLLNVSGRTVDTHRGRIRKKLGLKPDEDLAEALRTIGE